MIDETSPNPRIGSLVSEKSGLPSDGLREADLRAFPRVLGTQIYEKRDAQTGTTRRSIMYCMRTHTSRPTLDTKEDILNEKQKSKVYLSIYCMRLRYIEPIVA
jgi:hypothetical protein